MTNPIYNGDFHEVPKPDRFICKDGPTFRIGIKTVVKECDGSEVTPYSAIVLETATESFPMSPSNAANLARILMGYVNAIESTDGREGFMWSDYVLDGSGCGWTKKSEMGAPK